MVCVITLTRVTRFSCTFRNQLHFSANEWDSYRTYLLDVSAGNSCDLKKLEANQTGKSLWKLWPSCSGFQVN